MTIRDFICEMEVAGARNHLDALIAHGAPSIIIENWRGVVARLEAGSITFTGAVGLLNLEYTGCTMEKLSHGGIVIKFEGGVNCNPARHEICRDVTVRNLYKMNANELRDYAVLLGADRKALYGTSKDALRLIVQRLEKGGKQ